MRLPTIKKLFAKISKKKKSNGYLQPNLRFCPVPGEKSSLLGGSKGSEKFRQWVTSKRRKKSEGYGRPVSRKKMFAKLSGSVFLATTLALFFFFVVGKQLSTSFATLNLLNVSEIKYSGCTILSTEDLREASGIILHQTSLLGLRKAQVEKKLEDIPWIARAVVKKNWPSSVEISIVENIPVALLLKNDFDGPQLYYIDKKGKPFLAVRPGGDVDYPVITGLSEIVDQTVQVKARGEVLGFIKQARSNNPHLPSQSISEIHVDPNGEMIVYLVEYTFPIFFGNGNTRQKYSRLVQVLKDLYKKKRGKGLISQVEYIQMKYLNDNVLVAQSGSG